MELARGSFPHHTKPLHHQVGGHARKGQQIAFLECPDGTLLKLMQTKGRGEREAEFYNGVYNPLCTNPWLLQLRTFLPSFYGVLTTQEEQNTSYLRLEDVAASFHCPCLLDIKMGAKTYDPLAGSDKIARELAKYPPAQKLGFQLRGMQTFDVGTASFKKYGKETLRLYTEEDVGDGLKMFFNNGKGLRRDLAAVCLQQLQSLLRWFEGQRELAFYASSLLLTYEGSCSEGSCVATIDSHTRTAPGLESSPQPPSLTVPSVDTHGIPHPSQTCYPASLATVHMIDFTHVFPLHGKDTDNNYIFGLTKLVEYFQQMLVSDVKS